MELHQIRNRFSGFQITGPLPGKDEAKDRLHNLKPRSRYVNCCAAQFGNNMILLIIVIFFLSPFNNSLEQTKSKTDDCIKVTSYVYHNIDTVNANQLKMFLEAFSNVNCLNNVEFGEWANELLFDLMLKRPRFFFETLFQLSKVYFDEVKNQIDHPVNDGINVIKIYEIVKLTKMPNNLRKKTLNVLQFAYESQKEQIKIWEEKNKRKWEFPK